MLRAQVRSRSAGSDEAVAGEAVAVEVTADDEVAHGSRSAALAQAERKYARVIESLTELVCEWDADGRITHVNESYCRFFGVTKEVVGRSLFELIPPEAVPEQHQILADLEAGITGYHVRRTYEDGRTVEWSDTVLRDGTDLAVVSVGRDVTQQVRAEEELARKHREAVELSRSRSALIAMVSHELRNPLHGMLGLTRFLVGGELPGPERELAESLQDQARAMRHVVDDLLDLAVLQVGGMVLERERVDLAGLVGAVVDVARRTTARPLDVRAVVGSDVPLVWTDEQRLRQVLANLVGNATKFTPAGEVVVTVVAAGEQVRLEVADTGIGIPPGEVDRIFDEFVQAPSHDRRGAGLGLAIVRALVQAMGGTIAVTSTLGEGSTFVVELPLEPAEPSPPPPAASAPTTPRILVVEDDPVNQLVARKQLERLGVEVSVAGTGTEALRALRGDAPFDLVFMDTFLPDLDGLAVTRRLRTEQGPASPPVVALTASAMASDREACFEAGMVDFLSKPVTLDELRRVVASWAGRGAAASPATTDGPPPARTSASGDAPPAGVGAGTATSPTDAEAPACVDLAALERLAESLGDRGAVVNIVCAFLGELDGRCEEIRDAQRAGDVLAVRKAAHTLRSTARLVGAEDLAVLCSRLHAEPSSVDPTAMDRVRRTTAAALRTFA